jgi:hypothetical protein
MLLLKIVAYQSCCVTVLNRLIGDFAHGNILNGVKEPMVYAVMNKQLQFKIVISTVHIHRARIRPMRLLNFLS